MFDHSNKKLIAFILPVLIFSCARQGDQESQAMIIPKRVEAKPLYVSKDQSDDPQIVPAGNPNLLSVEKPIAVETNSNTFVSGKSRLVIAGLPKKATPGQDGFSLPKSFPAIDHPLDAGQPEPVIAYEENSKEANPQNFSSFGIAQGLLHSFINCIVEDRAGNIWIGTDGAGASKFDGKSLTHYAEKEGLSNNEANAILEDRAGNIWFGTDDGAFRFNGRTFTHFGEKEGLKNNFVECIYQDSSGNIWFGTFGGGVSKYDGRTFTQYTEREGLSNNSVGRIFQDRQGVIWFCTIGGGVSRFDGKSFYRFTKKEGLSNDSVFSIWDDQKGSLWFATDSGVSIFDGKSFSYLTTHEGLSNNTVEAGLQDKEGNFWFCTEGGGVCKYDGRNFTHFTEREGLTNNKVENILQDRAGNLWFATNGGGISKFNGNSFKHFTIREGLRNNNIFGILEDKSGNIWFGSFGGGISKYDGRTFTHYPAKPGSMYGFVKSLCQDRNGNLWFGTYGGGVVKFDGKHFFQYSIQQGLPNNIVFCILEDRSGNLWFGTNGGGVSKFDGRSFSNYTTKQGLSNNIVFSILQDRNGILWFGTNGGGLSRFDGHSFIHFTEKAGLPNDFVLSMMEDRNGLLWFGTGGGGVASYDGKYFTYFTEREGLSNNFVESMFQDKSGNLWFGTRYGLSKLNSDKLADLAAVPRSDSPYKSTFLFKNFTYEDGFLGIGCSRQSICEDKNGDIWIGTNDRLTVHLPKEEMEDHLPPNIQITGIELFNEKIPWTNLKDKQDSGILLGNGVKLSRFRYDSVSSWYGLPANLSLAHNNNYVSFQFFGITQKSPKKIKYQFKLDGNDENWSSLTSNTEASYFNLASGEYNFRVKAMNSEGIWSPEIHYRFSIRPPWWKTWWAYALYLLIILGTVSYYIKRREKGLLRMQKFLEQTVEKRTAEVVKQKERSEELLLNILPAAVAEELKQKGSAEARQFSQVTVMFTDFIGFTQISEKLTPAELVAEIHTCFKEFDSIISKYNIEKIKTIGDSYMCAGGLPVANQTNATEVVCAALEIQQFNKQHLQQRIKDSKEPLEIRIGIHTGPVVAGIVGFKKFAYDIWGDTVNIASRMESSGESGKVNISGSTYQLIKNEFICTYRGKIQAKNKGMIDMYFVESKV